MSQYRVQQAAGRRIDDIFIYTREKWGQDQAEAYIRSLFARFDDIVGHRIAWRNVPIEFGVDGFYCRYEHHYIYWRMLSDGAVGIVTILHARMHQIDRFREDAPD
ncbi:type II toxin-antitoxin system RelE/ParE family toxin [Sphingobium sp.]|uniref:type II toxin-antitoxin system RelE/ParE family toxin n=1 Tax=Sphingobium sp. TaxID=1912891 RepID=UPI0026274BCC|nr:type II toxin-antitoxin system RelE/ParE family toxin [Sphingobium sp.]